MTRRKNGSIPGYVKAVLPLAVSLRSSSPPFEVGGGCMEPPEACAIPAMPIIMAAKAFVSGFVSGFVKIVLLGGRVVTAVA